MQYYVYIMTNSSRGTLYIGVTSDLPKRTYLHKTKVIEGFSARYGLSKLVYFEKFEDVHDAIKREKQMKKWNRIWKVELIETSNPDWKDLYESVI